MYAVVRRLWDFPLARYPAQRWLLARHKQGAKARLGSDEGGAQNDNPSNGTLYRRFYLPMTVNEVVC